MPPRRASRPALLATMPLLLALAQPALAWGPYGHAMVADIAQARLTPAAAAAVTSLLSREHLSGLDQVASWPDTIGHIPKAKGGAPETLPWHYVDIDDRHPAYERARDCPGDNCVVEQLPRFEGILADANAPAAERLAALKWVVHLVGDIHQPLHASQRDDDKGGNAVRLTLYGNDGRGHMNLHSLWDEGIIDHEDHLVVGPHYSIDYAAARRAAAPLAARITPDEAREWSADVTSTSIHDAVVDWADESHALARVVAYGALPSNSGADIGDEYTALAWPVIQIRLEQAGVRLAAVLNAALGPN